MLGYIEIRKTKRENVLPSFSQFFILTYEILIY